MSDFLSDMAASSARRAAEAAAARPAAALEALLDSASAPPPLLLEPTFNVIAEIKLNSPAEGALASAALLDHARQACCYRDGGAAAISVLTEPERFGGQLDDLARVAGTLGLAGPPAMRKDFVVNAYQLLEARLAGAGGVLLITAMLDDAELATLLTEARALGLFVLLECFDAADIARSSALLGHEAVSALIDSGQFMLGVNTRNLRTLEVDDQRLQKLAPLLPQGVVRVAESGLREPQDAARAVELGYQAALIGTALMRSDSPTDAVAAFVRAGRG